MIEKRVILKCDRCLKEVDRFLQCSETDADHFELTKYAYYGPTKEMDLCVDCGRKLNKILLKFMNQKS